MRRWLPTTITLLLAATAVAQSTAPAVDEALIAKRSTDWSASLNLGDAAKESRVREAISTHLRAVHAWHNAHPSAALADATPALAGPHAALLSSLRADLTPEQVETVLDRYTVAKVAFTMKGYEAIVPDLTDAERATLLAYLKQAREEAIDQKQMTKISDVFGLYKDKCEAYLNSNGRNWRQLYKAYTDKIKAEKAAATKPS